MPRTSTSTSRPYRYLSNKNSASSIAHPLLKSKAAKKTPNGRRHRARLSPVLLLMLYVIILMLLVVLGNLFQDASFGVPIIVLYGIISLIFRLKSEITFGMAFVLLVYLVLLTVLKNQVLMNAFSEYVFLLFSFGMVRAMLEQYHLNRQNDAEKSHKRLEQTAHVPYTRKSVVKN